MTQGELAGIIWGSFATALGIIAALGWRDASRTLIRLADRNVSLAHKLNMARREYLQADMDRRLARRRESRPLKSQAARKGWQTRRAVGQ